MENAIHLKNRICRICGKHISDKEAYGSFNHGKPYHVNECIECHKRIAREKAVDYRKRKKEGKCFVGHGMSNTRLYRIWIAMKQRCDNPRKWNYQYYGGKGVTYCEEWKDFVAFKTWAESNGYAEDLSIDRIDFNRGYSPDNCRWVTQSVQAANRKVKGSTEYIGVMYIPKSNSFKTSLCIDYKKVFSYSSHSKNDCARKRNEYIKEHHLMRPLNEIKDEYEVVLPKRVEKAYYAKNTKTGETIMFETCGKLSDRLGIRVNTICHHIRSGTPCQNYMFWKMKVKNEISQL